MARVKINMHKSKEKEKSRYIQHKFRYANVSKNEYFHFHLEMFQNIFTHSEEKTKIRKIGKICVIQMQYIMYASFLGYFGFLVHRERRMNKRMRSASKESKTKNLMLIYWAKRNASKWVGIVVYHTSISLVIYFGWVKLLCGNKFHGHPS